MYFVFANVLLSAVCSGDAVVCNKTSRSVTLVGCLLGDKGISYSDLRLYDRTCRGVMDSVTHMVTIGFDTETNPCGTMIKVGVSPLLIDSQQATRCAL